jgi:single-stranded-DNA-specific exonuclease
MNIKTKATIEGKMTADAIFEVILESRGHKTKSDKEVFLNPVGPTLPYLLKESGIKKTDLAKAMSLLDTHLQNGDDICIFGDYDADGVTSTAIMWQAVTAYGKIKKSAARILPFIPDRHKHGYGLSESAVTEVISGTAFGKTGYVDFSPKLIITIDTGIVAHSGVKSFKEAGIDVIVTDHHLPTEDLPAANCFIHTTATSGAGVAWIFSLALLGEPAMKLLDLAVIGVVGDMMPLTGLNRSITSFGLKALTKSARPGLLAMKAAMGTGNKALTTYDISFGIAPRINAAGRIYSPLDALRLLCTSDAKLAGELATKIESHNKDRQEYTDSALKQATQTKVDHKIIVIIGDYHEGVIGLVAGKLVELWNRPAVVMSDNGDVIKGSARSVPGVNITGLLRSLKTPFLGLGGHEQAAGFSLSKSDIAEFTKELEMLGDDQIDEKLLIKTHSCDMALPLSAASLSLAKLLTTLEPFGMANPKPKFLFSDLTVLEDRQLGAEGKHRKLTIEQQGVTKELMLFNTKEKYPLQTIKSVIATIDINVWREKESLQLIASYVET